MDPYNSFNCFVLYLDVICGYHDTQAKKLLYMNGQEGRPGSPQRLPVLWPPKELAITPVLPVEMTNKEASFGALWYLKETQQN